MNLFAGNPGHKVLMRGMKPLCAKGVRSFYLAHYDMDHSTGKIASRFSGEGARAYFAYMTRCRRLFASFPHVLVSRRPVHAGPRTQMGNSMRKYIVLAAILLTATACGDTWGQRAVTGGGIGAASGAVLGAATGFNPLPGRGGSAARAGAGIGAATHAASQLLSRIRSYQLSFHGLRSISKVQAERGWRWSCQ
ncbi:MAG: hypothetical protein WDN31_09145 [Hyphomicrobium sp.]